MSDPESSANIKDFTATVLSENVRWAQRLQQTFPQYFPDPQDKQAPKVGLLGSIPHDSLITFSPHRSFGSGVPTRERTSLTRQRHSRAPSSCTGTLQSTSPNEHSSSQYFLTLTRDQQPVSSERRQRIVSPCIRRQGSRYPTQCVSLLIH